MRCVGLPPRPPGAGEFQVLAAHGKHVYRIEQSALPGEDVLARQQAFAFGFAGSNQRLVRIPYLPGSCDARFEARSIVAGFS